LAAALAALLVLRPVAAQQEERVTDELARLLAAADTRVYDTVLFEGALRDADPFVRRQAALAAGCIGDSAALTVAAFLSLVDRRYFDGSTWHRVVSNFVVQDGDPRGDGWGGPAFMLRDEINPVRYEAGTVGMALSGPDTGGSQVFIMHSPQPHLDGPYTVFGRVVGGRDVLDRISQGEHNRSVHR
jgi:cyclophilin family peptidyl-prolyl cis-trans isomerase